jgi:hypothetical protein
MKYPTKRVNELIEAVHEHLSCLYDAEQVFNEEGRKFDDIKALERALYKLVKK